jgi:glycosyltransferase involved in cell wall biosynthesis
MKISIITPNYNYAQYLPELLRSVAHQDYPDIEHVLVDDGSTDESVKVIQQFAVDFPGRFKLIQQANAGQSAALNTALQHVTGDLVLWINSDDYFTENIFSEIAAFFVSHAEVDILVGDIHFVDLDGRFIFTHHNQYFGYREAALLGFTMFLSSNAVVWRKEAMRMGLAGFRADYKCNMDGEFYSRLFFNRRVSYKPWAIANFRKQPFSKAAENDDRWNELMYREINQELDENRVRIGMSSWPNFVVDALKYLLRIKRAIIRVFSMRNFKKNLQIRRYQQSLPS